MIIQECPVIKSNEFVTVIQFGDIRVQLPSVQSDKKHLRVAYDKGKYYVVNDEYQNDAVATTEDSSPKTRKISKKTTVEELNKNLDSSDVDVIEQNVD